MYYWGEYHTDVATGEASQLPTYTSFIDFRYSVSTLAYVCKRYDQSHKELTVSESTCTKEKWALQR